MGKGCLFLVCCLLSGKGLCVGLRSLTECGVFESDRKASMMKRSLPTKGVVPKK